jgi:hypothetical protein
MLRKTTPRTWLLGFLLAAATLGVASQLVSIEVCPDVSLAPANPVIPTHPTHGIQTKNETLMPVSLDMVTEISRAVAAEQEEDVERVTIASTSAEADRVELLVTPGPHPWESRRFMLNLSRRPPITFERQLRARLQELRRP